MPLNYYKTEDGFDLGVWVKEQRHKKAGGEFNNPDWQQRLEALPGWSWAPGADQVDTLWEKGYTSLQHFMEQHGHSRVPDSYTTNDGFRLAQWVYSQRMKFTDDKINPYRRRRLEALPGWVWKIEK
jgi:hypothetical protein